MAARTWSGAISGDVTVAGNYDALPTGADTLTIPASLVTYPSSGTYAATGQVTVSSGGSIVGGTWPDTITGTISNGGTISTGVFNCVIENLAGGVISGGVFSGTEVDQEGGAITGGTFNCLVEQSGGTSSTISGGVFNAVVNTDADATGGMDISGGIFNGNVSSGGSPTGTISAGTFNANVDSITISGGTFNKSSTIGTFAVITQSIQGTVQRAHDVGISFINGNNFTGVVQWFNPVVTLYSAGSAVASIGPWPVTATHVGPWAITADHMGPFKVE